MGKKKRKEGNKYAHLSGPQATFDFHGQGILTKDEICQLASSFIEESSKKGYQKVLIITGKGLHSSDGPVIGPLLQDFLVRLHQVESVRLARRDRGGEGALEIALRA